MAKQRLTPASSTMRSTMVLNSSSDLNRRAEKCGIGSKPNSRTARAAESLASSVSPGKKVTAIGVASGILGAASRRSSTYLAEISKEKPSVMNSGSRSQFGWISA